MKDAFIFLAAVLFILQPKSFCQSTVKDTSENAGIDTISTNENNFSENNSVDSFSPSYFSININAGYSFKDDFKLPKFSKNFYLNVNYSISYFIMPLEASSTQVGLFNELGLYNTSLYSNLGPEARIDRNFYLIPYGGISLIPFSKYQEELAFIYYLGISSGYIFNLDNQTELRLEIGTDFIKFQPSQNNYYLKAGIGFNLFHPY